MTSQTPPTPGDTCFLDESGWRTLLRDIHKGQVLPVIGPELVTIPLPDGRQVPLYQHLANELAKQFDVSLPLDSTPTLDTVACAWLLSGKDSMDLCNELRSLLESLKFPPPQALLDLASINDFGLYISTTFDSFLSQALVQKRPGFLPGDKNNIGSFNPNESYDLQEPRSKPFLYHILGSHNTYSEFAVWEEDYIEYVFGLLLNKDNLRHLFAQLLHRDLLLIGSPFNSWIVRLFLRVVKDKRFSKPRVKGGKVYVAEEPSGISPPTIFFYEKQVGSTRIIPGDPSAFARELARQWRECYAGAQGDIFQCMGDDMPRGSVFISYSRDDLAAATELARGLMAAQVPVWMDKGRISVGENYERSLEHAVKNDASFFISLISKATESNPDRCVHKERAWAAQRHVDGYVYYIPVLIIDEKDLPKVEREPVEFTRTHRECLPGGRVTPAFAQCILRLVDSYRTSGSPRG